MQRVAIENFKRVGVEVRTGVRVTEVSARLACSERRVVGALLLPADFLRVP